MTHPAYAPPPAPKPRPSAWWFAVGGGLLLLGLAAFVGLLVWTITSFADVEATVPADGRPHAVRVGTDEDRMTWTEEGGGATNCTIVDTADGQVVVQSPVFGATSRSGSDGSWIGSTTFDPGSGDLEVTCGTGGGARVQIGPEVSVGGLIGGILLTVLAALVLGGAGLVVLIVTGVLFLTRPPRGH